jgi:outer membrane protein assembly factor BamB
LYCLDLAGRLLWQRDLGALDIGSYEDHSLQWGYASSPVLVNNTVYIQADIDRPGFVAALDADTGRDRWRVERAETESWSTPAVQPHWNPPQVVLIAPLHVTAYHAGTGQRLWRLFWGMDITESTPVVTRDSVFVASGKGPTAPILAIHPSASGDITPDPADPVSPGIRWRTNKGGPITTTPLYLDGFLYTVSDFGIVRCYDAATGSVRYEKRIAGAAFQASPVAAGRRIYLTSVEGDVYVLPAGPAFSIAAHNRFEETIQATPAIAGGRLYIRTRAALYCIGTRRSASE